MPYARVLTPTYTQQHVTLHMKMVACWRKTSQNNAVGESRRRRADGGSAHDFDMPDVPSQRFFCRIE